jgi:hypothetical protein
VSPGTTITAVVARAQASPVTTHSYEVSGELYAPERYRASSDEGMARDARARAMMAAISDKD